MLRQLTIALALLSLLGACCHLDVPPIPDSSAAAQRSFPLRWQPVTPDPALSIRSLLPQIVVYPDGTITFVAQFVRTASDGKMTGELHLYRMDPGSGLRQTIVFGYPAGGAATSTALFLSNFHFIPESLDSAWPVQHPMPGPSGAASLFRVATHDALFYSAYTLGIGSPPPRLLRTTNNGLSWQTVLVATQNDKLLPWLDVLAAGNIVAAHRSQFWGNVPYSELYVSRDAGKTWSSPVSLPTQYQIAILSASLTPDGYIAACDQFGSQPSNLMVSSLSGALVSRKQIPCVRTSFVTRSTGLFTTQSEARLTTDAGASSNVIFTAPADHGIIAARAVTADHFILLVQKSSQPLHAAVYETKDRGATWNVVLSLD